MTPINMCGIFAYLSNHPQNHYTQIKYRHYADKCKHRGPDQTEYFLGKSGQVHLVFHRLKIVDTSDSGMQPFHYKEWTSVCNAEIYNHEELRQKYDLKLDSGCDTEVVIPIIQKLGPVEACKNFDGVFAFVVASNDDSIWVGRDPIGVRSLFVGKNPEGEIIFASEMKSIPSEYEVSPVLPGTISNYRYSGGIWKCESSVKYYNCHFPKTISPPETDITQSIRQKLSQAISKRTMSDRPVGCLLSGGLDSSIIASVLSSHYKTLGQKLRTFSIGLSGSVDLKYAKQVAEYLGTDHTEIVVTEEELLSAIPRTIYHIESYDITTVRASTPMLMLSEYISKNTDIVVVYSGEGSDEASGSYIYFHNAPSSTCFREETERLMDELHYFDVLRCDKSSAAAGLEIRVPFLDKNFLDYYMTLDPQLKQPRNGMEKYLLRKSFQDILPKEVTWRKKEGMSDGISSMEKPWYSIIQEESAKLYSDVDLNNTSFRHNPPKTTEQYHYRLIFEEYYSGRAKFLPHFWMPKWSGDVDDPSARVLQVYNQLS